MKLIDILNMISKGELKEGTTFRDKETGMKISEFVLGKKELSENRLNEEYELIEPKEIDHFADVGKMAEKIEELDVLGIGESQNIDNLELANSMSDLRNIIREMQHKINEVIRRINNVR